MEQEIDFLDDINLKYTAIESELEQKWKIILQEEQKLEKFVTAHMKACQENVSPSENLTLQSSKKRNADLIKALEMSKARLRSRATYSPLESILEKAVKNYLKETSLVPSIRKIYGPTFV